VPSIAQNKHIDTTRKVHSLVHIAARTQAQLTASESVLGIRQRTTIDNAYMTSPRTKRAKVLRRVTGRPGPASRTARARRILISSLCSVSCKEAKRELISKSDKYWRQDGVIKQNIQFPHYPESDVPPTDHCIRPVYKHSTNSTNTLFIAGSLAHPFTIQHDAVYLHYCCQYYCH